ncbi:MAG: ribonuclease HII [Mycoplasmoidaceae bacterium]
MKNSMNDFENKYFKKGFKLIAGIDEVGRGALCGPIVVAICILPEKYFNNEINDSKKLSPKKRIELNKIIRKECIDFHIEVINPKIVDKLNPKKASIKGMKDCLNKIKTKPDFILIDAEKINSKIENLSIIKGDQKSISIASASILAKVYRDDYMIKMDKKYPNYFFENNKGYGTKTHLDALNKYGPIKDFHRFTYKPIKK